MNEFDLLDEALALQRNGASVLENNEEPPVVSYLSCGDFHVCWQNHCKFASYDPDTRTSVCMLTGLTWGRDIVTECTPSWTGRSASYGNVEYKSGVPVGGWKPKRDVFSESRRAYDAAAFMVAEPVYCSETTDQTNQRKHSEVTRRASRGARCVGESHQNYNSKKPRVVRAKLDGVDAANRLRADASNVLGRLTRPLTETHTAKAEATKHVDPRLTDLGFVTAIALQKWARRVAEGTDRCDASRMHDVLVAANEFVRVKRNELVDMSTVSTITGKRRRVVYDGVLKSQFANLIVALWRACASTPYLSASRRGGDSFRPFVSGVAYLLKRGVRCSLLQGAWIVPCLPCISEDLPTLRSADASPQARQLQSQSHRGICALTRSISSVENLRNLGVDEVTVALCLEEFRTASIVCQQFVEFVNSRL